MSSIEDTTNANVASSQPSIEGNSAASRRAVVSPLVRALFPGNEDGIDVDDIPSQHVCPLTQEPPFQGVHFDVPDSTGRISDQVFERSELYRWIATPGTLSARRNVSHPFNRQVVPRSTAWNLVRPVSAELQALLHRERRALNYPLVDDNPLTDEDRARYDETMMASVDRFVIL
jgi:hypothetical protein